MLQMDQIVKVNVLIGSATATPSVFDVGLVLGESDMISASDRVRQFSSLSEVKAAGFPDESPEYKAAKAYFGVSPAPSKLLIGVIDDGETAVQALAAVVAKTNSFYGVYVCGAATQVISDVDTMLSGMNRCVQFYGVTGAADTVVGATGTLSAMFAKKSKRSMGLYSGAAEDAAAMMGAAMGLSAVHRTDSFALCYKRLPGVTPLALSQQQVDAVKAINGNVYITRGYNRDMLENGTTAHGLRYDEVMYLDQMAADMQDACVSLIADRAAKLPQNDTTSTLFISRLSEVLDGYTAKGVLTAGEWRGAPVGTVETGDVLQNGYYIHIGSYSRQSQADREAHKAMPITCCVVMAGSVESVELTVYVQR